MAREVRFGLGKGKVYPAANARALLNPLRRLVQPPGRLAERLGLAPDARVLELGPGPGYFSCEIARRLPQGQLCLFDLQAAMLRMARERTGQRGLGNVAAIQGDALQLPFRSGSFDAAVLVAVLGEIPGPGECLAELLRVLKPGGLLAISETRGDPDRIKPGTLREQAETAGFAFERTDRGIWTYTSRFRRPAPAG